MYVYLMLSIMNRLGLTRSYVTCTFASALVSKGQISIWHICLILKLALYKYHIIIIYYYLHNEISYTDKKISLYWIGAQNPDKIDRKRLRPESPPPIVGIKNRTPPWFKKKSYVREKHHATYSRDCHVRL